MAGLLVPRLPRSALKMAVAIVGAGIMPANFYLHSALVHSRSVPATCNLLGTASLPYRQSILHAAWQNQ